MSARDSQRDSTAPLGAAIEHNADSVRRMRRKRDFLTELGLSLPITPEDVKQAFRVRAKSAHPDHAGGSAEEFRKLQGAYDEALEYAKRNGKRLPWIGTQMPMYLAQRNVVELVEAWGGQVELSNHEWLVETVGDDFAQLADRLLSIDLSNCKIGDAELKQLTEQPEGVRYVELLFLSGTSISDDGILEVSVMRNLRYVDLRDTRVSPTMRKQIARIDRIERVEGLPKGFWNKLLGR